MIKHRHHIIPLHAGGDYSESNLTPPISIRLHAAFHMDRWQATGDVNDYIAWQALLGRLTTEEARLAAAAEGQRRSVRYQESRKTSFSYRATEDECRRGGIEASKALVRWQQENREQFIERCRQLGRARGGTTIQRTAEEREAFSRAISEGKWRAQIAKDLIRFGGSNGR